MHHIRYAVSPRFLHDELVKPSLCSKGKRTQSIFPPANADPTPCAHKSTVLCHDQSELREYSFYQLYANVVAFGSKITKQFLSTSMGLELNQSLDFCWNLSPDSSPSDQRTRYQWVWPRAGGHCFVQLLNLCCWHQCGGQYSIFAQNDIAIQFCHIILPYIGNILGILPTFV